MWFFLTASFDWDKKTETKKKVILKMMSGKHFKAHEVSCCIKYFIFGFNIIFWVSPPHLFAVTSGPCDQFNALTWQGFITPTRMCFGYHRGVSFVFFVTAFNSRRGWFHPCNRLPAPVHLFPAVTYRHAFVFVSRRSLLTVESLVYIELSEGHFYR